MNNFNYIEQNLMDHNHTGLIEIKSKLYCRFDHKLCYGRYEKINFQQNTAIPSVYSTHIITSYTEEA